MSKKPASWTLADLEAKGFTVTDGKAVRGASLAVTTNSTPVSGTIITQGDKQSPQGNKKVRNAIKITQHGITFDSKLENYLYNCLKAHNINFEFQKKYILQKKFLYNGEAIREITLTVDFILPDFNMILDSKGFSNDVSPVKYKMLKWYLFNEQYNEFFNGSGLKLPEILMPKNRKEVDALMIKLMKL